MKKIFIVSSFVIIFLNLFFQKAEAQNATSSTIISLLTASPGEEVYERFGHTAIRIKDTERNLDYIYNYGLFSFDSPNFIYRFVKGETDYQLGVEDTRRFLAIYAMRGSRITEQILNLTDDEKNSIINALVENYKPQNKIYRYNFFFDNCSTRPRDIVENNIGEKITYFQPTEITTFRKLVHQKTDISPWLTFGIDLTLGIKADKPITYKQEMFLPEILMQAFDTAKKGNEHLVQQTNILIESDSPDEISPVNPLTKPMFVCWSLFFIIVLLSLCELLSNRNFRIIDTIFFGLAGLAGIVLFFLNFISTHPTVDNNFNCFWLQPFQLFAAITIWVKSAKKLLFYYHFVNFVILLLLLISYYFIGQQFNPAFFPLIGILMVRSTLYIIKYKTINI